MLSHYSFRAWEYWVIFKFFTIKEFKKFWPFYGLVVFTVLLGTLGLSGISLISSKVQGELNARAKELLTSDFALNARRNFTEEELKFIEDLKERSEASYKVVDIYSMLTLERTKDTRLVEVRGIEEGFPFHGSRSEEHTSELQSRPHLVCRLLLEKKKKKK